mmetsp:Transcript_14600/g.34108  ORF Transcript_14600/g.34108 Transcript_14600/m.34108 type:complete len:193 (-) Transcript_14600:427-1005(-)
MARRAQAQRFWSAAHVRDTHRASTACSCLAGPPPVRDTTRRERLTLTRHTPAQGPRTASSAVFRRGPPPHGRRSKRSVAVHLRMRLHTAAPVSPPPAAATTAGESVAVRHAAAPVSPASAASREYSGHATHRGTAQRESDDPAHSAARPPTASSSSVIGRGHHARDSGVATLALAVRPARPPTHGGTINLSL